MDTEEVEEEASERREALTRLELDEEAAAALVEAICACMCAKPSSEEREEEAEPVWRGVPL